MKPVGKKGLMKKHKRARRLHLDLVLKHVCMECGEVIYTCLNDDNENGIDFTISVKSCKHCEAKTNARIEKAEKIIKAFTTINSLVRPIGADRLVRPIGADAFPEDENFDEDEEDDDMFDLNLGKEKDWK